LDTEGSGSTAGCGELKKLSQSSNMEIHGLLTNLSKPPLVRPFVITLPRISHYHKYLKIILKNP